ncbi:MAG: CCA tRNA nucleotidyltransferase [Phycisphaerales bacterium]
MSRPEPDHRSDRKRAAAERGAVEIVRALRGQGKTAYLAGGCVRDTLLGLAPTDFDVATNATPDEVLELFDDAHAVGKSFGVVIVRFGRGSLGETAGSPSPAATIEVATFRREGAYSDKRRPDSVEFCGPDEDAKRRDFTINAMFLDPLADGPVERRVIDSVGGLDDIRDGIIRAVGNPADRLAEDHLRALRAVRFASRFGFAIEPVTGAAIREHAADLQGVSPERIGDELRRMLGRRVPVEARRRAIELIECLNLAIPILGSEQGVQLSGASWSVLDAIGSSSDFPTTLLAWLHDREGLGRANADKASDRLVARSRLLRRSIVLSNKETDDLVGISRGLVHLERGWTGASVSQRKRWAASDWFDGALVLLNGRNPDAASRVQSDRNSLASDPIGLAPEPWVSGDDLIASGLRPGPDFKVRLARAYDAQLEGSAATAHEALQVALADPD